MGFMRSTNLRYLPAGLFASLILGACVGSPDDSTPAEHPDVTIAPKSGSAVPMPDKAPAVFKVQFKTTVGDMVLECHRDWAPKGADRFFELVKSGFFEEIAFFRVIPNFMAQFGIHGDPEEAGEWRGATIEDDPVRQSNSRGTVTFATGGPNTRTTQMFINFKDNRSLDDMGFAPFAKVVQGVDVLDRIYKVGEGAPVGPGPNQGVVQSNGNDYLKKHFPKLTYIKGALYMGAGK